MGHVKNILKFNWDLRGFWRGLGQSAKILWCFFLNREITGTLKKDFHKQQSNSRLFLHACRSKTNLKNVAAGLKKENLLLTHYSHVLPALKDVKHVARVFSKYFANNKLKNETRELAKNAITGFLTFWKSHLLIVLEITPFVLVQSSCLFKNFLFKKWRYFKRLFKSMQCFL